MIPSKTQIQNTYDSIRSLVHRTPVLESQSINTLMGAKLYFKCENFQKMGAFKMRGALYAIQSLSAQEQAKGVVTHSSGNFGQAVALAAKQLGVTAHIVMPENAPKVKVEAVKGYGGRIYRCASTLEAREATSESIQSNTGATFLHPSNQLEVILGNATATIELLEQVPSLDAVVAPVGGGGLLAGTALAANHFGNGCLVYGAEPSAVDDAFRSFQSGKIQTNATANTIADGLRTNLGTVNFPIIKELVEDILLVDEQEIIDAMRLVYERLKIVIEPSSAVPLAAVWKNKVKFQHKNIGIIISGGNVDLTKLPFLK